MAGGMDEGGVLYFGVPLLLPHLQATHSPHRVQASSRDNNVTWSNLGLVHIRGVELCTSSVVLAGGSVGGGFVLLPLGHTCPSTCPLPFHLLHPHHNYPLTQSAGVCINGTLWLMAYTHLHYYHQIQYFLQ